MRNTYPFENRKTNNIKHFFNKYIGLRIFKTALAISLSMFVAHKLELKTPIMAGLATTVTMTTSVSDSFTSSINRVISTITGFLIAAFFRQIGLNGFLPMFFGILIIINICNYMKWHDATNLAMMVFLIVMLHTPEPPNYLSVWDYGLHRLLDTFIGLIVGVLVNVLIAPPSQAEFIVRSYQKTLADCEDAILQNINGELVDADKIINDINHLVKELNDVKRDSPFNKNTGIKISELSRINIKFYSLAGSITQSIDTETIPCLSDANREAINKYFGEELSFERAESCPVEYESAYNYQINHAIGLLTELRKDIAKIDKKLSN